MQPEIPATSHSLSTPPSAPQYTSSPQSSLAPFGTAITHLQATQADAKNWFISKGAASTSNEQRLHITASTDNERLRYQIDT